MQVKPVSYIHVGLEEPLTEHGVIMFRMYYFYLVSYFLVHFYWPPG